MNRGQLRPKNDSAAFGDNRELIFGLGFRETDNALTVFKLTAFTKELYAFKTFQNTTLGLDGALAFQTWMLTHKFIGGVDSSAWGRIAI